MGWTLNVKSSPQELSKFKLDSNFVFYLKPSTEVGGFLLYGGTAINKKGTLTFLWSIQ